MSLFSNLRIPNSLPVLPSPSLWEWTKDWSVREAKTQPQPCSQWLLIRAARTNYKLELVQLGPDACKSNQQGKAQLLQQAENQMQSGNPTNKKVNIMSPGLEQHWAIKSANKTQRKTRLPEQWSLKITGTASRAVQLWNSRETPATSHMESIFCPVQQLDQRCICKLTLACKNCNSFALLVTEVF